jgi:hypothetical protein
LDASWIVESHEFLEGQKIDVIGAVDCLGNAEDAVGDRFTATEER